MLAIVDARAPKEAIINLGKYVDQVFQFESAGITLDPISGHPDIFIYQDEKNVIVAPNTPTSLFDFLDSNAVNYLIGEKNIGASFEKSVRYNCIGTPRNFFHKTGFTDQSIINHNQGKIVINLPQAYTRCSMTYLCKDRYITSDKGIERILLKKGLDCFYFSAEKISMIGHKNGFLGGTNGIYKGKIFFIGNIDLHEMGHALRSYIEDSGIEIISLTNNFLYDGGGIFFLETN